MKIVLSALVTVVLVTIVSVGILRYVRADGDAAVERQAQVPAPMGAVWCKSADECPRKHVRPPE